jgi:iron complex outermembrane receptor protein
MIFGAAAAHADSAEAAAGDLGGDRLEELTVVARKRAENPQDVPIPVTILSGEQLERENLVNFTNFLSKFPAFSVYLTNPKQLNLGIRGIGNNGFNTDGIDGSVGVFVDGVYSGRLGMASGDFSDIDQVELLRGPQGTLFGKNTTAGAVIINSRAPSFTPEASGEATLGNFGYQQYKINASAPLVEDKLAARLSAFYDTRDGYYPNISGGEVNGRQGEGVRLQLLERVTDDLSVRLIASHSNQGYDAPSPVTMGIYNPNALQSRMAAAGYSLLVSDDQQRQVNLNNSLASTTRANMLNSQVTWDLGAYGSVTNIAAYQTWFCHTYNDQDYTQLDAIRDYGSCNNERQFSEEARWASPTGGAVEAVAGTFVSSQELVVSSRIQFGSQYNIWAANPSASLFPNVKAGSWASGAYAGLITGAGFQSQGKFHTDTEAAFANVSWHPDEARRLSVDFGLRPTWESKRMTYDGWVVSNPGNLSQAQLNLLSPSSGNAQLGQAASSVEDYALSGQTGLHYRLDEDMMVYAGVARGHKSKGFNLLAENGSNPDPNVNLAILHGATQAIAGEESDNVEIGVKSEWLDHHLLLNGTLFDTLVKNYQANESIGAGAAATKFLANVGFLRSKGAELEAEARLLDGLHLKGFAAYDLATYASFRNAACPSEITALSCDLTNRQVAWAPKWTSDLSLDYMRTLEPDVIGYVAIDENWRSAQNTTITLDPQANIKGYALTNLRFGALLMDGKLDAQFWFNNLFNRPYWVNLLGYTKSTGIIQGYPGDPLTIGATLRVRF